MIDYDAVLAQLKIAVLAYPMKAMAYDTGKKYETLSNELSHRDSFKLGFITALQILSLTQSPNAPEQSRAAGIRVLDIIEAGFGRVAFVVPPARDTEMRPVMEMVARISKEFGENMTAMARALADGKITAEEAADCLGETGDLIAACMRLKAFLEQFTGRIP